MGGDEDGDRDSKENEDKKQSVNGVGHDNDGGRDTDDINGSEDNMKTTTKKILSEVE